MSTIKRDLMEFVEMLDERDPIFQALKDMRQGFIETKGTRRVKVVVKVSVKSTDFSNKIINKRYRTYIKKNYIGEDSEAE